MRPSIGAGYEQTDRSMLDSLTPLVSNKAANMMKIQAAVSRSIEAPFSIETCELSSPGAGEVLVKIHACGVCHTDLAVKLQHIPIPFPQILGHEGAGVVEAVGENVSGFKNSSIQGWSRCPSALIIVFRTAVSHTDERL
jgi:mono/diheme cytochrome c family protein